MTYEDVLGLVQKIKNFAVVKEDQLLLPIQELQILTEKAIVKNRCNKYRVALTLTLNLYDNVCTYLM